MGSLHDRHQIIVDELSAGPRTSAQLARACGYECGESRGRNYVSKTLSRLAFRGYVFTNMRRPGDNLGAFYVLMGRPSKAAPAEHSRPVCMRCGRPVAADHIGDLYCSPCGRALLDEERAMMFPPQLFEAVAS
jgi:ribosomal protein L37E